MFSRISSVSGDSDSENSSVTTETGMSRTELDSHANMAVGGRNCIVLRDTGETTKVNAFSPDCNSLREVPIRDLAVKWTCPVKDEQYILIMHNALHVPGMENNLIPPFLLREAGIVVNDIPKIHVDDPQVQDHSLYFPD